MLIDRVRFISSWKDVSDLDLRYHEETGGRLYYRHMAWQNIFSVGNPIYHALLKHIVFDSKNVEPIWVDNRGYSVIGWYRKSGIRILLIGLDVVEEFVRHKQGDPEKPKECKNKSGFGFEFERPNYLFEDQVVPQYPTQPWADNLGFFLVETISRMTGNPLLEPLPSGARGLLILTGDDDQACLEKYTKQLEVVGDTPITYFMHYKTRHDQGSIKRLPQNVGFAYHPDALDQPAHYEMLCSDQLVKLNRLIGKRLRIVRNHGFLNDGYLGHLEAWETNGLKLDVNYAGVDGTALNGTFLPWKVRRPNGTWSPHYSLMTLFGDGMIYALGMSQSQAIRSIKRLAAQIGNNFPGVMVFNFHPQNIEDTFELHKVALSIKSQSGWIAMELNKYLEWIEALDNIEISKKNDSFILLSHRTPQDLIVKVPVGTGWRRIQIDASFSEREIYIS
jgi:hypothetical protein